MKLLLIGSRGQLGGALIGTLAPLGEVLPLDRSKLDLCDTRAVRATIGAFQPDVVVNAAAYTSVDEAELKKELAHIVNASAPQAMACAVRESGGVLVTYSTDYVFDGRSCAAYDEDGATSPLNVYGASKLAGELAIAASGCAHLIFRTSWLYSASGRNFFTTMLRLAAERRELRVVDDQVGAPTWARWVAQSTAVVLRAFMARREEAAGLSGVYHMTAGGETSWFGFASAIVEGLSAHDATLGPRIVPVSSEEYASPALRPARSVLSNEKLRRVFGVGQVGWREQLGECLKEWSDRHRTGGPG